MILMILKNSNIKNTLDTIIFKAIKNTDYSIFIYFYSSLNPWQLKHNGKILYQIQENIMTQNRSFV